LDFSDIFLSKVGKMSLIFLT